VGAQLSWEADARWNAGLFFDKAWPLPAAAGAPAPPTACLSLVFTDTTPLIEAYQAPTYRARLPELAASIDAATPAATVAWTRHALGAAAAVCDAVFLVAHHPLDSPGEHGDAPELQKLYEPLLASAARSSPDEVRAIVEFADSRQNVRLYWYRNDTLTASRVMMISTMTTDAIRLTRWSSG
jgi:hypothetical protein